MNSIKDRYNLQYYVKKHSRPSPRPIMCAAKGGAAGRQARPAQL